MPISIMLDAGHGGRDPGAVYNGRQEKDDVLNLVFAIGQILQENGIDVLYTRTTDIYETPFQKATEANEAGVDYFVSIHRNSFPTANTASGVETLVYNDSGIKVRMAENINAQLANLGFRNLGIQIRPNLVVLRRTNMPAVLVEVGFINNNQDNEMFDAMFNEIAQAIADGILETVDVRAMNDADQNLNDNYNTNSNYNANSNMRNIFDPENHFPQEETIQTPQQNQPNNMQSPQQNRPNNSQPPQQNLPENIQIPQTIPSFDNTNNTVNNSTNYNNATNHHPEYPQTELYHVQAGAFRNEAYAKRLLNELLAQDYPAFIDDASRYYRVRVGTFDNLNDAALMERRLKRAGYATIIVTH